MTGYREDGQPSRRPPAHASDAEFARWLDDWLDQEQRRIDDALASGAQFIINLAKVHTLDCPAVRDKLDRRTTSPFGWNLTVRELRQHLSPWPRMPEFATQQEVNASRRYTRCRRCSPDVLDKAPKPLPTTRAGNIGRSHIGRTIGGRAIEWVRLERNGVELGFDDDTVHSFDLDDRISLDPKSQK